MNNQVYEHRTDNNLPSRIDFEVLHCGQPHTMPSVVDFLDLSLIGTLHLYYNTDTILNLFIWYSYSYIYLLHVEEVANSFFPLIKEITSGTSLKVTLLMLNGV